MAIIADVEVKQLQTWPPVVGAEKTGMMIWSNARTLGWWQPLPLTVGKLVTTLCWQVLFNSKRYHAVKESDEPLEEGAER